MSREPKPVSSKPSKAKKPIAKVPFSPAAFLETAARGRVISVLKKKDILFEQGDPAEFGHLYKIGQGQSDRLVPAKETKPSLPFWGRTSFSGRAA